MAGTSVAWAQRPPLNQPDMTIDGPARSRVLDGVPKALHEGYVFPEIAAKMAESIQAHVKAKEYDAITSAKELARKLTEDLQAVSHDKHVRVQYSHTPLQKRPEGK